MTIAQNMTIEEINMAPGTPGTHKKKNPIILIKKIKNKKEEGMIDRVRFPRQEGISFDRAERIPGWKRFESFTCRPGTLRGVCYRLTVARQFFQFALEQREKAHFASFFNRELVERHIEMIVADELAKAKTKVNKLWALRYTLGWLENCLCLEDIRITGDGNIMGLRYLGALISAKVSQLHQQAKIDVSLSIQKEVMIDRQNYLDREQFSILGRKLIERLNVLEIALRTPSSNRTATAFAYRRTIFTAFFVLIPVQRLRVIFDLRWKDVTLEGTDGGNLQIGIEKTSFAKLGRCETIGRALFLPEILCVYLRAWRTITKFNTDDDYLFGAKGRYLVSSEASRLVIETTKELVGKRVSAQALRKLRITHVLDACNEEGELANAIQTVAEECGNSEAVIRSTYWIQDSRQRSAKSRVGVEAENSVLFGG